MAIDILTRDIVVDEPSDRTDGHVDPPARPHCAMLQYLSSREGSGGLPLTRPTSCKPHPTRMGSVNIGNRDCETATQRHIRR
ncbi:hypothetical protein [Mesorhizobium sp.]|uniref:hypothetical protein n=1 Tax=Mesorhizobium sp. TaxID=1871066 RepID=UPI000FE3E8FC|nr:hypothetical protein [Mesorhizobium sp.]RWH75826.1 MAG: hypothetical protein EOQ84_02445 [Mesorhizobium sp.]RWL28926.1 MAG: hypothetical protein EOR58_11740 [Mesorhizobium sp.]RWL30871.1 MAG: hypothetical protein EOR63_15230 [Mesorhizobium sp.]RWL37358.1 MAG: hypothetical protein EOR59_17760 [Mesorhizobium sp.]RWL45395.1 MAG: hypothetical protein EOR61_28895 [Mesorhizobium sp.]